MINLRASLNDIGIFGYEYDKKTNNNKKLNNNFSNALQNKIFDYNKVKIQDNDDTNKTIDIKTLRTRQGNQKVEYKDDKIKDDEDLKNTNKKLINILQTIQNLFLKQNKESINLKETNLTFKIEEIDEINDLLEKNLLKQDKSSIYENMIKTYENLEKLVYFLKPKLLETNNKEEWSLINKAIKEISIKLQEFEIQLMEDKFYIQVDKDNEFKFSNKSENDIKFIESIRNINDNFSDKQIMREKTMGKNEILNSKMVTETQVSNKKEGIKEDKNSFVFPIETSSFNLSEENIEIFKNKSLNVDKKQVLQQITNKAKLLINDNKQEIRIKLKPEILGELTIKMESQKGNLLAKIIVDNYKTKDLIEANLYQFKEDMKESGLDIKTFEVFVDHNGDFQRENRQNLKFKQKLDKLKVKDDPVEEIKVYSDMTAEGQKKLPDEGRLNLFA